MHCIYRIYIFVEIFKLNTKKRFNEVKLLS